MDGDVALCIEVLENHEAVELERGLSSSELWRAEQAIGARFPDDLRELLSHVLPKGQGFPDWREPESENIRLRMYWPRGDLLEEVDGVDDWCPCWGETPADDFEAVRAARTFLDDVPLLIPIYGHRYLPAEPSVRGNPVLSVMGRDIIYYGSSLSAYLCRDFLWTGFQGERSPLRRIRFWSDHIDWFCCSGEYEPDSVAKRTVIDRVRGWWDRST